MSEKIVLESSYSKLQRDFQEAEFKLHLARTQRNEALVCLGELAKELEQCKAPESSEAAAERERKAIVADRLGVSHGEPLAPHVLLALDERDRLRAELAVAMQACSNLEIACSQAEDELKELRIANKNHEELAASWRRKCEEARLELDKRATFSEYVNLKSIMETIAAAHYGWRPDAIVYLAEGDVERFTPYADVIVEKVREMLTHSLNTPQTPAVKQPTEDEVLALAKVLSAAYHRAVHSNTLWNELEADAQEDYKREARAAIAHIRKRPEGLPTAEDLHYTYWTERRLEPKEVIIPPSDEELTAWNAILAVLVPYLRDPVGWELDVSVNALDAAMPVESFAPDFISLMREKWPENYITILRESIHLCRSRIRPTYECKECANWKAHAAAIEDSSFDMIKRINLARAALEGE